jgi:hypothetical protein
MADKVDKPKKQKAKSKQDDKGVLAALPSTRPERIGGRRGAAPAPKTTVTTAASAAAKTNAKPAAAKAKPRATSAAASRAKAKAAPKPRATAAAKPAATTRAKPKPRAGAAARPKRRATATRRKAAAPRTFEPTQAAEAAAGAADERAAGAVPLHETPPAPEQPTYPRPRPVREGAPGIGTGYRDQAASESGRPSGVQLAATAVRAAGEVAQLGVALGGELLKGVAKRLPRP